MRPKPIDTVADHACGTGGFLLAAHDYMAQHATSKKEQRHLKEHALAVMILSIAWRAYVP